MQLACAKHSLLREASCANRPMSLRESYFARSICKPARLYDELNDDSTKAFSASTPGRSQKGYLEGRTSGLSLIHISEPTRPY